MPLWPRSLRKVFDASMTATASQRITIVPPSHLRDVAGVLPDSPVDESIGFVVDSVRARLASSSRRITVRVSSSPSRSEAAADGCFRSSCARGPRACASRACVAALVGGRDRAAGLPLHRLGHGPRRCAACGPGSARSWRAPPNFRGSPCERLLPSMTKSVARSVRSRGLQIGEQTVAGRRVLRRALVEAEHVFVAVLVDTQRDQTRCSSTWMPSIMSAQRASLPRSRPINSASFCFVAATNRRLTALRLVPRDASPGGAGSIERAYFRVETPSTICSTARGVSGSASANCSHVSSFISRPSTLCTRGRRTRTR